MMKRKLDIVEETAKELGMFTPKLLAEKTGISQNTVRTYLVFLEREGKVERITRGFYRWRGL